MGRKCIIDRHRFLAFKIWRGLASVWLTAFMLAAIFLTSSPMPGHAQVPEESALYQENFDDGQAQGWELEPGWVVRGDRLNGKSYAQARYTAGNWGDGSVTFKFSLVSLQGDMHANFRMSEMGCYAIGFRYTEQCLAKEILYIYLFKKLGDDKVYSTLAQSTIHYDQVCENIEIVTEGGKIQVYMSEASPEFQPYRLTVPQEVPMMVVPPVVVPPPVVVVPPVVVEPPVMVIDYVDSAPLPCGTIAFETFEDSAAQIDDIIVAGPPVPCPRPAPKGPDLIISSIRYWFENDGRVLVLSTGIKNQGNLSSPETLVSTRDQDGEFPDSISLAPGLSPGETTTLERRQELAKEQRGKTHTFLCEVDPKAYIPELDENNNRQTIDISVPVQGGAPWWIIPVLVAGGAGYSLKRWNDRRQTNVPKKIQVRPQMDIGRQQIESAAPIRLNFEIRLRPVLDHGKQDIETKGPLIIDKPRQPERSRK